MRKVKLNTNSFLASKDEKKFVILSSESASKPTYVNNLILPKIYDSTKESVPGFWGTLGFSDDKTVDWAGHVEISNNGNDSFTGVVAEEIELIKQCYPNLKVDSSSILERFISFEHIDFNFPEIFSLDEIPELRLDIMLEPKEGAIVFYQSENSDSSDVAIEYIQPRATEKNDTINRDRLTYFFDVIPQHELEPLKNFPGKYTLSTTKESKPFIVKIITFKRIFEEIKEGTIHDSKKVILDAKKELNKFIYKTKAHKPHKILVYKRSEDNFFDAKLNDISPSKRTLFLMHGTFATTKGSFKSIYNKKKSWLKRLSDPEIPGHYQQIIAFDHPTLFFGAKENIEELHKCLKELNIESFDNPVDFISSSQGGLLVQHLANTDDKCIKVGKAALISSANGVGYFKAGKYVAKFLSVLKHFFKVTNMHPQALVSAIAQHSAEFLLEQPGFQIMTPDHKELHNIIDKEPVNDSTLYYPIISDYDESLYDSEHRRFIRFLKRMGSRLVDAIAKSMLGEENDWVVGTREQFIVPYNYCAIPDYNPGRFRENMIPAIHGTCKAKPEAQKKIEEFLFTDIHKKKTTTSVSKRIDAHCHILGSEVITSRILFLLLEELISYKNANPNAKKLPIITDLCDEMEKSENPIGAVIKNIIKYFVLNKNSYQSLKDLEDEYFKCDSDIYRFVPLMIDLEMSFRNNYKDVDIKPLIDSTENTFIQKLREFIDDIDSMINKFEKYKDKVFEGSLIENEESIKVLKLIKKLIKALKLMNPNLKGSTVSGFNMQLDEMKVLKKRYGNNIFPFLAVDPRRKGMAKMIKELVVEEKIFQGVKLYAPNGYSPTDSNLFDDSSNFIDGLCLYSYCIKNNIPIMIHCSNAGYATFVKELQVNGDLYINDEIKPFDLSQPVTFQYDILDGGFAKSVRERAEILNHPKLWDKVLDKHKTLKICFAHFGGESDTWRELIAELISKYENAYTDLSCMTKKERLEEVKEKYFDNNNPIAHKIMYGSDYYLNMLSERNFEDYFNDFKDTFSKEQLDYMSIKVPEEYLGVSGKVSTTPKSSVIT